MKSNKPVGIKIFAALIIITSLIQMHGFTFKMYEVWFGKLPVFVFWARYIFSWALRILGITVAIGLLKGKDLFRRIGIYLFIFTFFALYFKHPYYAILNHATYMDTLIMKQPAMSKFIYNLRMQGIFVPSCTVFAKPATFVVILGDAIFCVLFVWYFTRSKIKELFT